MVRVSVSVAYTTINRGYNVLNALGVGYQRVDFSRLYCYTVWSAIGITMSVCLSVRL